MKRDFNVINITWGRGGSLFLQPLKKNNTIKSWIFFLLSARVLIPQIVIQMNAGQLNTSSSPRWFVLYENGERHLRGAERRSGRLTSSPRWTDEQPRLRAPGPESEWENELDTWDTEDLWNPPSPALRPQRPPQEQTGTFYQLWPCSQLMRHAGLRWM